MKVFISHGHDELVRAKLAEFVTREGYEPIVLKEDVAPGKTIVEKLEAEARDADCALVVLTHDDQTSEGTGRARQNVIHELGYFHGKLKRERVVILLEEGVEWLSNLTGLEVIKFQAAKIEYAFYPLAQALRSVARQVPLDRPVTPMPPALTWTLTAPEPTALVRVFRGQPGPASPVVHGANDEFMDLFEYYAVSSPDSKDPLTMDRLVDALGQRGHVVAPQKVSEAVRKFFESMFLPRPPVRAEVALELKGHPKYGNRVFNLYLIGRGVVDELDQSQFVTCLVVFQEDDSGLHLGRVSLDSLKSQNVVTVVLSRKTGGKAEASIKVASSDAARFYGYAAGEAARLKGKTLGDLALILQRFMEPEDYDAFVADQLRVNRDYEETGLAWARVPIRFNNRHRDIGFRNTEYYPIISHSIVEGTGEEAEHYIHVLYVNLPLLLEHLPRAVPRPSP